MDGYVGYGGMSMARGGLARIEDGKGMLLYVWDGELWITQERDRRDYYVKAGEWFRLDRDGTALACALRPSRITVYERARQPGGWLAGLRQRFAITAAQ